MKTIFYIIVTCTALVMAHGFTIYPPGVREEKLRREEQDRKAAESFMVWTFVRPAVLVAASQLPEAKEIQALPQPTEWKYSGQSWLGVEFESGKWRLGCRLGGTDNRCTVFLPLRSRNEGHGVVAFEFKIKSDVIPSKEKELHSPREVMTGLDFVSFRYLTDDDDCFIRIDD